MSVTVLALIGRPCAGKSTVTDVLSDLGVPCVDTGDEVRQRTSERLQDDVEPDEADHWATAKYLRSEHGPAAPTILLDDWLQSVGNDTDTQVACISSLRDQAEVEWIRDHSSVDAVLVVEIVAGAYTRTERYVEKHLDDDAQRASISRDRLYQLRSELYERENRESPYPETDVSIHNDDEVSMRDLWRRLDALTQAVGHERA